MLGQHIRDYANARIEGAVPTILGSAGVDIFFVISGFVMVITAGDGRMGPGEFAKRRLVRVVPLYWLFTLLMLALLLVGMRPAGVSGWSWSNVATSFLFLPQTRADGWPGPILPVGWTLNYEMFFYLVFAMGLCVARGARLVALIGTVFVALVGAGMAARMAAPVGLSFPVRFYTDPILLEFVAGCGLGLMYLQRPAAEAGGKDARLRLLGVGLIVAGVAGFWPGATSELGVGPWRALAFGVPSLLLVAGAVVLEQSGLRTKSRWVMLFGAASYAMYLSHMLILQTIEKLSVARLPQSPVIIALTALVGIVAVVVASIGIHLWIETPLVRWLRVRSPTARGELPASAERGNRAG